MTRALSLHPNELCVIVCKHARLIVGPSELQPLLAFRFLTTEHHARAMAVPLDCGNLDVVPARYHSRALGIAFDRVNGLACCIHDHRVENIGGAAGDREFE